jgi:hypothetical protein
MIKFNKPVNLNGTELLNALNDAGVTVNDLPYVDGNSDLWLDIPNSDKTKAESIVAEHNGTIIAPEPTIQDKLANAGISLDELKTALGL